MSGLLSLVISVVDEEKLLIRVFLVYLTQFYVLEQVF